MNFVENYVYVNFVDGFSIRMTTWSEIKGPSLDPELQEGLTKFCITAIDI